MQEIATIGYEGVDIHDFVEFLLDQEVDVLYDVRELPSSRKKGFSKNSLSAALGDVGIQYIHSRDLGDPKPGRDAARSGDLEKFQKIFRSHMNTDAARQALEVLKEMSREKYVCLMCYERDPNTCHRNIVIEQMLIDCDLKVRHLGVPDRYARMRSSGRSQSLGNSS